MDSIPFILILALIFALMFITEFFKVKKEVRKSTNVLKILNKEVMELKNTKNK